MRKICSDNRDHFRAQVRRILALDALPTPSESCCGRGAIAGRFLYVSVARGVRSARHSETAVSPPIFLEMWLAMNRCEDSSAAQTNLRARETTYLLTLCTRARGFVCRSLSRNRSVVHRYE
jgi:hypothetical protein